MQQISYPNMRWFLLYESFDAMENTLAQAICHESAILPLQIASEREAMRIAKAMWDDISKVTYTGWDKETYPRNPRLVCRSEEIPLTP